eukprot:m.363948 g.363948  ORF g.363948 m.363948 type:complete len:687 (+) comp24830_c0_seq1:60-2120(+)
MGASESALLAEANGMVKQDGSSVRKFTKQELGDVIKYLEDARATLMTNIQQLSEGDGRRWQIEYAAFNQWHSQPATASVHPMNAPLNRYKNITAFDHSRVKITPNVTNRNNDYINANYVPGVGAVKYIASQGPVPHSFNAFWQMVWEQNSNVIVMVTNLMEGGKLKCHKYWPDSGTSQDYGGFKVVAGPKKEKSHYTQRRFIMINQSSGEKREIVHYLYTAWPDHGVPNSAQELLHFRHVVYKEWTPKTPVVIHCSAGVGRTGTFIAVDTLIRSLEVKALATPHQVVNDMRKNRNYLVQTLVQYQFVFKAYLEAINKRLTKARKALEDAGGAAGDHSGELTDIENELVNAQDDFATMQSIQEEVERELAKEQGLLKEDTPLADARHAVGPSKAEDLGVATQVSFTDRMESLGNYITGEQWREKVGDLEQKGYRQQTAPLTARLSSLSLSSAEDAWKTRYTSIEGAWSEQQQLGGEEYEVAKSFDPLESRIMSLAQQKDAWKLKTVQEREQLYQEHFERLASLSDRFQSLDAVLRSSEERWRERGDGLRGKKVVEHKVHTVDKLGGLSDRLQALAKQESAWKDRGAGFRGVVERPETPPEVLEERLAAEAEAKLQALREEEERLAREEAERRAIEEAKPPEIVKGHVPNAEEKKKFKFFSLKRGKKKEREQHPMVAAAKQSSGMLKK